MISLHVSFISISFINIITIAKDFLLPFAEDYIDFVSMWLIFLIEWGCYNLLLKSLYIKSAPNPSTFQRSKAGFVLWQFDCIPILLFTWYSRCAVRPILLYVDLQRFNSVSTFKRRDTIYLFNSLVLCGVNGHSPFSGSLKQFKRTHWQNSQSFIFPISHDRILSLQAML